MTASPLTKTVRAVRRRIWFQQSLGFAEWSLRPVALVAWLLVALNLLFIHVSMLVVVALAALALVASQVWAIRRLPRDPSTAALQIDRWLDTNELVTTGWYLRDCESPSGNAVQISTAAEQVCLTYGGEVRRRSRPRFRSYVCLGLIVAACFPLAEPGHLPLLAAPAPEIPVGPGFSLHPESSLTQPTGVPAVEPAREQQAVPSARMPAQATTGARNRGSAHHGGFEASAPGPGSIGSTAPRNPLDKGASDAGVRQLPAVIRVPLALRSPGAASAYDGHGASQLRPIHEKRGQGSLHDARSAALPPDRLQPASESFPIGAYIRRYSTRRTDDHS